MRPTHCCRGNVSHVRCPPLLLSSTCHWPSRSIQFPTTVFVNKQGFYMIGSSNPLISSGALQNYYIICSVSNNISVTLLLQLEKAKL